MFRYVSTFSGIGGMELGIARAVKEAVCVGYSEIDKYAIQIYQSHFPDHHNYGDITKIDERGLPDIELLCGGFPCQSFSLAGKRGGFEDTRGTLFFDIARIIKVKRPRLLLLENVKGLLSHDGGRTFNTIISVLDELGYDLQWEVLNSKDFGVPQNRERVFIVGHLRGTPRPQVFPLSGANGEADRERIISTTIDANYWKGIDNHGQRTAIAVISQRARGKNKGGLHELAPTLSSKSYQDNNHLAYTLKARGDSGIDKKHPQTLIRVPEATKKGYAEAREGQSINLAVPNSKTRRGRVSDIAQTLDTGMQQHTLTAGGVRRLTPVECERLQGFPDNWTAGVSDTQRYKTLGNAVTVNVIEAIIRKMYGEVEAQ